MPNEEMGGRILLQPPGVHNRAVVLVTGAFLAFVALSIAILLFVIRSQAPDAFSPRHERPFPAPALQKAPQQDLVRYEAEQRKSLANYRWIDRDRGIARIPIEEAMRMVAARGAQAYDPLQPSGARP